MRASKGPHSSRCLDPRGWALLFAGARFGRVAPHAPSVLELDIALPETAPPDAAASLDVLDADPPHATFVRGAGRAFTRCVPPSGVSCRLSAPARRLLPDRKLTSRPLLSSVPERFHPETRIVPRSPRTEELSRSVARRRRNDSRRLPSYRNPCLPMQTRVHFSHPGPTPCGAGQNHASCLPCDGLAIRTRTVLARTMRSNRLLLPTASFTSTRASGVPSISSKLAPRSLSMACFPGEGDRGIGRFTTHPSASAGDPGSRVAFSAIRSRTSRASDTPVASPEHAITFVSASPRRCQGYIRGCSVKRSPHRWPEVPSVASLAASYAGGSRSRERSRDCFRVDPAPMSLCSRPSRSRVTTGN